MPPSTKHYRVKHYPTREAYFITPQVGSCIFSYYYDEKLAKTQARRACKLTADILNCSLAGAPRETMLPLWEKLSALLQPCGHAVQLQQLYSLLPPPAEHCPF